MGRWWREKMIDKVLGLEEESEERKVPERWIWTTLAEIAQIVTGTTPSKAAPQNYGDAIPFVKPGDLDAHTAVWVTSEYLSDRGAQKSRILPAGSIMVTCIGATIGKTGISGRDVATNQQINSIVLPDLLEPYFVYFYCLSKDFQDLVKSNASSTTLPILNKSRFSRLPIPLAPLPEQHRIVAEIERLFTQLDAGVAALKRVRVNLQRYKASVLKAACEGKLVPQDPGDEPASQLLARILAERRTKWEADLRAKGKDPSKVRYEEPAPPDVEGLPGLPELPEGWVWASMDQLLTDPLSNGRSVPDADSGFPVLRLTALKNGRIILSERKIGEWTESQAFPYLVQSGDFYVARGNGSLTLVGRGGLVEDEPDPVAYPDTMIRVRVNTGSYLPKYLRAIWNSKFVRSQIQSSARTTAGIYKINQQHIRRYVVPLPPLAEQHRIAAEVERRLSVAQQLDGVIETNLKRAERLRQAILKRAFEGKLVAQDPEDEPAGVLLERITAAQNKMTTRAQSEDGRNDSEKKTEDLALTQQSFPELIRVVDKD
jgi:type I restriction enzyme S subunit